jgi:hypothetical protein
MPTAMESRNDYCPANQRLQPPADAIGANLDHLADVEALSDFYPERYELASVAHILSCAHRKKSFINSDGNCSPGSDHGMVQP